MKTTTLSGDVAPVECLSEETVRQCLETLDDYGAACLDFAHETREWGGLQNGFYTTDGTAGWQHSSDNANGGMDVRWAFHQSDEYIHEHYAAHLLAETRLIATCLLTAD